MRQLELEFEESSSSRRGERTRAGVCPPLCARRSRRSTARRASIVSLRTSGAAQQAHHCLTGHGPFPTHNTYPQGGHCQLAGARRARGTEGGQSPLQSSRLLGDCQTSRRLDSVLRRGRSPWRSAAAWRVGPASSSSSSGGDRTGRGRGWLRRLRRLLLLLLLLQRLQRLRLQSTLAARRARGRHCLAEVTTRPARAAWRTCAEIVWCVCVGERGNERTAPGQLLPRGAGTLHLLAAAAARPRECADCGRGQGGGAARLVGPLRPRGAARGACARSRRR